MPWAVTIAVCGVFAPLSCDTKMASNDKEIQKAASNMLERYGANALKEVDLRIMELESRNQPEALQLWREIRESIELLMDTPTDGTRH